MWIFILFILLIIIYDYRKYGYQSFLLMAWVAVLTGLANGYSIDFLHQEGYNFCLFILVTFCYVWVYTMNNNDSWDNEVLIGMTWLGSLLVIASDQLILTYLGLELQTFSTFVLVAFRTDSISSGEGALNYFILGAVSSGLFLLSLVITYYCSGGLTINSFNSINYYDQHSIGTYLLVLSMFFKLSLFPVHFWIPDIYEACPNRIMTVVGTLPNISVLGFILQLNLVSEVIMWCALGSILVGTFGAMNQSKLNRLLGYSGITHMGMAIITLGLFSSEHVEPTLLYMVIYIVGFLVIILLMEFFNKENFSYLYDLSGLHQLNVILAISWSFCLLSAGGIPPFSGFLGKWWVVWTLLLSGYNLIAFLCIVSSIIGMVYYLRVTQLSYFQKCHSYLVWENAINVSNNVSSNDCCLGFVFYFVCFLILNPSCLIITVDNLFLSFF